jgi:hypothetical protein
LALVAIVSLAGIGLTALLVDLSTKALDAHDR